MKSIIKYICFFITFSVLVFLPTFSVYASNKTSENPSVKEQEILDKVNEIRTEAGLSKLVWNNKISLATKVRALEVSNKWSHTRPNGKDFWTVNESIFGENLGKTNSNETDKIVDYWEKSSSHLELILDNKFQSACIGIYYDEEDDYYYIAMEFCEE